MFRIYSDSMFLGSYRLINNAIRRANQLDSYLVTVEDKLGNVVYIKRRDDV